MRPVEEPSCRRLCHEGRDQAPEVPRYANLRPVHSKVVHSFAVHGTKLEPIPQPCATVRLYEDEIRSVEGGVQQVRYPDPG